MTGHRAWLALAAVLLLSLTTPASAQSAGSTGKKTRALVLSGGGPICEAWEEGLVMGMAEKGVDLSTADLIVGTSAGSIVGAQLALSRAPASMRAFEAARAASMPPPPPPGAKSPAPTLDENYLGKKLGELAAGKRPPQQVRAEIGAWALSAHAVMSENAFVSIYRRLFPDKTWTQIPFECVAVDARDGSIKVFSKDSGVGLARAVAASCAVPGIFPPVTIDGHRYIDGGMRSLTNADLAKGYGVVVVVDFIGGARTTDIAKSFGVLADRELKILRDSGSTVESIAPDTASLQAFGPNRQDLSRRKAAFAAGIEQGRGEAQKLKSVWKTELAVPVALFPTGRPDASVQPSLCHPCMSPVVVEKWMRQLGVGDRCHSGPVKGGRSARIPTLTSKGEITRTVARAKPARIVGKDG